MSMLGRRARSHRRWRDAVKAYGGEIRTEAEVTRIQVDTYTCKGVVLANGEEISADIVISAADPKRTLLYLWSARMNLPPEFVWKTQSIKMRGSVAKVHLLTDGNHGIPDGTVVLAPSIKYLEQRLRRGEVWRDFREALSGSDDFGQCGQHPFPVCAVCIEE